MEVVKDYAALSQIWMGDWPEKVFAHAKGNIVDVSVNDFPVARKSYLPPMPKSRPRYGDVITEANKAVARKKLQTVGKGSLRGRYRCRFDLRDNGFKQGNRIALIVLDSTIEIAFERVLRSNSGTYYTDTQLLSIFKTRHQVPAERSRDT